MKLVSRVFKMLFLDPVTVTPEQIVLYGKTRSRSLQLEVNVIAYFGQILQKGTPVAPSLTVRPSVTAGGVLRPLPL